MENALEQFITKIEQRFNKIANTKTPADMPKGYVDDLAAGIDGTYKRILKQNPTSAMEYKKLVKNNAIKRGFGSAHQQAYNKCFYDQIAEI